MRRLALARYGWPEATAKGALKSTALAFGASALALGALLAPKSADARTASAGDKPAATGRAPAANTPDIEELFSDEDGKQPTAAPVELRPEAPPASSAAPQAEAKPGAPLTKANRLADLSTLSAFSDIAVIQKRFLPKTKRFEFYAAGSAILNDPFFVNMGANLRLGYSFSERWGVEFVSLFLTTFQRDVTKGLEGRRITTTSLVTPNTYFGLDAKWTPIYGKMTLGNERIIPFDLYFSAGAGATGTNQGSQAPTLHVGTGQIFAMSKSFALRWDLSWNLYSTTSSTDTSRGTSIYNNIFMTVGASFFFPEATYR